MKTEGIIVEANRQLGSEWKLESVVGRGYTEKQIALLVRIKTLDDLSRVIKAEREQTCHEIDNLDT